MIRSIALQNFQSHDSSLLEFDPGVNVIVGDSDGGKTAILRALNWILTNRPTGEAFRRYGSDKTIVTVGTSEGSISRIRSNKDNLYLDGSGEKLAAIGTSVPEPVLKLLKMDPDINIQRQLDAPFLLSCSPGEVAQRLNASVGLDEIDTGLANAARRVRQNQSAFSEIDTRCKGLFEQVGLFTYLADMEQDIRSAEDLSACYSELASKEDSLARCIQEGRGFISLLAELPDIEELLVLISESERLLSQRERQMVILQSLSAAVFEIEDATEALDRIPDVNSLLLGCEEAMSVAKLLQEQRQISFQLRAIIGDAVNADKDLQIADNVLVKNEARFHKGMPLTCPLCGRKGRKG